MEIACKRSGLQVRIRCKSAKEMQEISRLKNLRNSWNNLILLSFFVIGSGNTGYGNKRSWSQWRINLPWDCRCNNTTLVCWCKSECRAYESCHPSSWLSAAFVSSNWSFQFVVQYIQSGKEILGGCRYYNRILQIKLNSNGFKNILKGLWVRVYSTYMTQ